MKYVLACWLFCLVATTAYSQHPKISPTTLKQLKKLDDSLQTKGIEMLDAEFATDRLRADSFFTRLLVRTLSKPFSFYFMFDSLQTAPVQYPPDSSFRIITWHLPLQNNAFRQKGVIQKNTTDGSLKIYPLFDVSDYDTNLLQGMRSNQQWVGAVYYKLLENKLGDKKVYTLLGYDENNDRTTKKWIDFLQFNEADEPIFGGNFLSFANDSARPISLQRFAIEYKKEGRATLNYSEEDSLIVYDHLVSETNEPEHLYTLIPGGDYETFKWTGTHWLHNAKWYMQIRSDGDVPMGETFYKANGEIDEEKLAKFNEENERKQQATEPKANSTPTTTTKPTPSKKKKP